MLGRDRERYAGKRVVVAGTGHSAFNVLVDLVELRKDAPETEIVWAVRREAPGDKLGGGRADQLPARGALGETVRRLVDDGTIELVTGFHTRRSPSATAAEISDGARRIVADEVIATTGFRPDLSLLAELRLDLDDRVEAPRTLAPLIDPNLHSCGSVPPHGVDELSHPDEGIYVVGMKSYGRAPTFLLRTGYEQVRSVVAALDGDWQAARKVDSSSPRPASAASPPARRPRAAAPAPRTRRSPRPRERPPRRSQPPPTFAGMGDRRRAVGHRDRLVGHPLLRLRGLPAPDAARARVLHRPAHRRLLARLLLSGVAGIAVGRYLEGRSPRALMTAGSIAGVLLVLAWSRVDGLAAFYALWAGIGLVMATVSTSPRSSCSPSGSPPPGSGARR